MSDEVYEIVHPVLESTIAATKEDVMDVDQEAGKVDV